MTNQVKDEVTALLMNLSQKVEWMKHLAGLDEHWQTDATLVMAAERALHISAETMTDIGNLVIDAYVMRDPGGYADIIRVLVEEEILRTAWFHDIEPLFDFRIKLLRDFYFVSSQEVGDAVRKFAPLFDEFGDAIFRYLNP